MKTFSLLRLLRLLWLGALIVFIANAVHPVSTGLTRAGGLSLFLGVWFGLLILCWRMRALRFTLLGVTFVSAGFLAWPARRLPDADGLRRDYVTGLRRYQGVLYAWGGESPTGIDCSGLIRRGLVDAMFCRGLRSLDPGLVRRSLSLWWHDCTANALGEGRGGVTVALLDTPSLNGLDHARVLPGDLAVTRNGVHILAYVGENTWIEADPEAGRVITVSAPSKENSWFGVPMKIVRWDVLAR